MITMAATRMILGIFAGLLAVALTRKQPACSSVSTCRTGDPTPLMLVQMGAEVVENNSDQPAKSGRVEVTADAAIAQVMGDELDDLPPLEDLATWRTEHEEEPTAKAQATEAAKDTQEHTLPAASTTFMEAGNVSTPAPQQAVVDPRESDEQETQTATAAEETEGAATHISAESSAVAEAASEHNETATAERSSKGAAVPVAAESAAAADASEPEETATAEQSSQENAIDVTVNDSISTLQVVRGDARPRFEEKAGVGFLRAPPGAHSCPHGSRHVLSLADCKAAADTLGAKDCTYWHDGHAGAGPRKGIGCAINVKQNCVHFNVDHLDPNVPVHPPSFIQHVCLTTHEAKDGRKHHHRDHPHRDHPHRASSKPAKAPTHKEHKSTGKSEGATSGKETARIVESQSPEAKEQSGEGSQGEQISAAHEQPDAAETSTTLSPNAMFGEGMAGTGAAALILGRPNLAAFAFGLGLLLLMVCGITACWGDVEKLSKRSR